MRWCACCWWSSCIAPGRLTRTIRTTANECGPHACTTCCAAPRGGAIALGRPGGDWGSMSEFIYLGSQSPRRRQLLEQLGVPHELLLPNAGEDAEALEALTPGEAP